MDAATFSALFLAHVLADYLLQTRWLVANKRRPVALGTHVALVLVAMPVVVVGLSPWFLLLAALHLLIDLVKTFLMGDGLIAYVADQALHVASIALVAGLAPDLWQVGLLAGTPWLPEAYLILGMLLFAARGGQYAVAALPGGVAEDAGNLHVGWAERIALPGAVALGVPWLIAVILGAKAVQVAIAGRARDARERRHLLRCSALSLGWGLACAAALWQLMPLLP